MLKDLTSVGRKLTNQKQSQILFPIFHFSKICAVLFLFCGFVVFGGVFWCFCLVGLGLGFFLFGWFLMLAQPLRNQEKLNNQYRLHPPSQAKIWLVNTDLKYLKTAIIPRSLTSLFLPVTHYCMKGGKRCMGFK